MTRLVLLGGFLGSGKTTAILRLAQLWSRSGKRVAVITNDQGQDLVDTGLFRAADVEAREVGGGCFCCRFDEFVSRADDLVDAVKPDIILAEPVGSCTDLMATVIRPLTRLHEGRFTIAPFTVLVDPVRAIDLLGGRSDTSLSEKVTYIFRMQQQEAQAVAMTKIDLLSSGERQHVEGLLRARFPGVPVLGFSSRSGEGLPELATWLEHDEAMPVLSPPVDYEKYAAGEAALGWLNTAVQLDADTPIDVDAAALALARLIRAGLSASHVPIAHGKVLVRGEQRTAVANFVGTNDEAELSQSSDEHAAAMDVVVNLRVEAAPHVLHDVFSAALEAWTAEYGLTVCGGLGQCFSPPRPEPTHRS